MNTENQFTFLFHDYETFGANPARDRPAQFAAIRTDCEFNIIEAPQVVYCQPTNDYLPEPEAVLITGITPQQAYQKGVIESEFARQIHQAFSTPRTCILGYNNIRFDDEVSRYLFYRNFYDPYAYSWQNGNSRWDLLDVVRACYALRPEGITWPVNEHALPSFRLEHLTQANHLTHDHAHDALSDVYATIAIAKLIKTAQPKLFHYLFNLRSKHRVTELIDMVNLTPLVHVSGMLGAYRGNTSWIAPLAWHPYQPNAVIVYDLAKDITPLLSLTAQELQQRLYTKQRELAEHEHPVPLKLVHINKCPVLAPAKTLTAQNAQRLGIDRQICLQNLSLLQRHHFAIREKVTAIFAEQPRKILDDVDQLLYQNFFDKHDKQLMELIHTTPSDRLSELQLTFHDNRLPELFFRYRARNYPETLSETDILRWKNHQLNYFSTEKMELYLLHLNALVETHAQNPRHIRLLKQLYDYVHNLY